MVIGSWQGTDDGWQDWNGGNQVSITALPGRYSYASGVVPGYAQSLQITQNGFNTGLRLNLTSIPADLGAFNANHILSFTFSAPAAFAGTTSGYTQMFSLAFDAPGIGFYYVPWASTTATGYTGDNESGMPNYFYYPGSPFKTQTVSFDYSSILPTIQAGGENYLWLNFISDNYSNGGGAPNYFWMNNVTLSGGPVPEPATGALALVGSVITLFMVRRHA